MEWRGQRPWYEIWFACVLDADKKRALLRVLNLAEGSDLVARWSIDQNGDLGTFDRIVMNPPFRDAEAHVRHALQLLPEGGTLAVLLRMTWIAAKGRWPNPLFDRLSSFRSCPYSLR